MYIRSLYFCVREQLHMSRLMPWCEMSDTISEEKYAGHGEI